MPTRALRRSAIALLALLMIVGLAAPAGAIGRSGFWNWFPKPPPKPPTEKAFHHVATFDVMAGNGSAVAEITDATKDGKTLVYTDSPNGQIGIVDITDPANPVAAGVVDVPGEPTSLVIKDRYAVVGVNTSQSFADPSGQLVVVDLATRAIVRTMPLPGQPDSLALAPLGTHIAVVIENERDEDLDDGLIPQAPSGGLVKVNSLFPNPNWWSLQPIDLSKVAAKAADGSDLEPEYVDINLLGEAVVSFQENNHLAIVNLWLNRVVKEFPAGTVELEDVDTVEDDLLSYTDDLTKRREPDAVAWTSLTTFATANEGDYTDASGEEGGSRGFTIFDRNGKVRYESAEDFEHAVARAGHYPEGRSENKGVEPEAVEFGEYGRTDHLFVGSERGNAVGVYTMRSGQPTFSQLLPTGIGPEGLKAIPGRDLFVVSTETDVADAGIPTMINIFALQEGAPAYPDVVSVDEGDAPIGWAALSGLAADPTDPNQLYAVSDAAFAEGFVYELRTDATPAEITERTQITGASAPLDLEGIAIGADGSMWLGSEGDPGDGTSNRVLEVDPETGAVLQEIPLPAELEAGARSNGIEGLSVTGEPGAEVVYVAIQRAWPATGDVDEAETKIGRLDTATGEWTFALYPLEPEGAGDWVGLSELTLLPDGTFAVVERDKGWGPSTGFNAELKAVYGVDLAAETFRALDDPEGLETVRKGLLRDLLPDLEANSVWTPEKVEGLTVAADGQVYVVTDNDAVDDATGETVFLRLGGWTEAFAPLELPERPAFELTVHHFNDAESDLFGPADGSGTVSRFGTLLAQLQAEASDDPREGQVTITAGDNFLAGPEWTASLESGTFYDALALAAMDLDALTIGNHEFDFGPEVLADFIEAYVAADGGTSPFLSANLDVSAEPSLAALVASGALAARTVVEEGGERIGIVGATTPLLDEVSSPGDVVVDPDVAAAVQAEVDALTAEGIDKVLVSTHLQDIGNELALVGQLRDVDAVLAGGGGEDISATYPLTATDLDGRTVPVVTVPGDYDEIGRLELGFDAEGDVVSFGGGYELVTGDLAEDPYLKTEVEAPVSAFLDGLASTVVAESTVGLNGVRNDVRSRETNLGNLVADSVLAAGQAKAAEFGVPSPVVALSNGGGIRNNSVIPAGDLTLLDTFEVAAFNNALAVIPDVSRDDLRAAIEHGLSALPGTEGFFGQWAGLVIEYDPALPVGSRVVNVELTDGTDIVVDGVVVPGAPITIATSAFLAAGQDGYDVFEPYTFTSIGTTDQQALADRLEAVATITAADPVAVADRTRIIPIDTTP